MFLNVGTFSEKLVFRISRVRKRSVRSPQKSSEPPLYQLGFEQTRVFKSEWFDLPKFVNLFSAAAGTQEHEDYRDILKHKISMKYLFIVGDPADFDNETFRLFLQHMMEMDGGKPF